ncbi:MAG TPA: type III secretion system chaperone [Ramlibacter sp.]|uniref:type III secretion system chaperone n=1 Tax=Ramlibacter sp. TaxID=1917967 RepID=UPI002B863B9C|nr:type III secretion system chaperone [Ramlibacter sp.]HVZ45061.1 type III secretion system chaperone [Ramlibacter sp.]
MDADQLLQSLSVALSLPELRFDANGCACLVVEGAPSVNFERDAAGAIHLYCVLGPLPPEGREALYVQLLQGNLFGASTGGASFAVDPDYGELVLFRTIMTESMSAPLFISQVEAIVAAAEDWQKRLTTAPLADAQFSAAAAESSLMAQFLRG